MTEHVYMLPDYSLVLYADCRYIILNTLQYIFYDEYIGRLYLLSCLLFAYFVLLHYLSPVSTASAYYK